MTKLLQLEPMWGVMFPEILEAGILYISPTYLVAAHLCPCGCAQKTVTPLIIGIAGTGWKYSNDFGLVSLYPSLSNSKFCPNKAHYYITRNKIDWL